MIKIFDENETSFITNGLGSIEPLKCLETKRKSLNGWEVEVEVDSRFKELIMQDRIIYVETKEKGGQPFRINNPAYSNHKISFTARHIGFDCERYVLDDVRPTNLPCAAYLNWINDRTDTKSPFSFYSNISKMATSYFVRKSLLEALEEAESIFDGIYDLNHYDITLKTSVGNDNGFTIIYGKNLQEAKAIEDWSNVCTKVMPVGPDGLLLPEKYILSDIKYLKPYSRVIEFSLDSKKEDGTDKTEQELIIELRQMANNYIENNKYPRVNYTVKSDVNQDLSIGDIIHVKSPAFMIDTEVQSYAYNVLTKKVIQLEFGNYTRSVKAVFDGIKDSIENATKETNNLIQHQTDLINRLNKEGLVYIDDNEILFLDKLPKEKAKNVWRFGLGGLGFSSNGYNGPFELAITQDGKINANFIMTGTLKAINVQGVNINGGNININNKFKVDSNGNMVVSGGGKFYGDITGGTITGETAINVGTDLTVGDNIYVGQNQDSEYAGRKYINFLKDIGIRFSKIGENGSIRVLGKGSVSLSNQFGGYNTVVDANIESIYLDVYDSNGQLKNMLHVSKDNTFSSYQITVTSDERLKENIIGTHLENLIDRVKIKQFDYISGQKNKIGVIAQDFIGDRFEKYVLSQDENGYYSVDYSVLYLAAIQKVQSLEKRLEALEKQLEEVIK